MQIKERDKFIEIQKLEAIFRRTRANHEAKLEMERDLKMKQTEITGERQVDYPLSLLDEDKYLILHNVRLEDMNGFFQMDTLLLCESFLLIIEVKNWQGTIIFGENGQVTRRTIDRGEEGFQNPVSQVKTQAYRLKRWLENEQIPQLPILYFVVISSPSTIIETKIPALTIPEEVIHSHELLFKVQEIEEAYQNKLISWSELEVAAHLLKEKHVPLSRNLMEYYRLTYEDLIKGVFCPNCACSPMKRKKKQWYCPVCEHYSQKAHYAALNDYYLLVSDQITNRKARNFLMLESRDIMKRLFIKGGYELLGRTKGSRYRLTFKQEGVISKPKIFRKRQPS